MDKKKKDKKEILDELDRIAREAICKVLGHEMVAVPGKKITGYCSRCGKEL